MKLLDNCTVVPVDGSRTVLEQAAIAIDGDRIAAIGPREELRRAYPDAETLDMTGRAAFPGFVNVHTHTVLTLLRGSTKDLGGRSSLYGQMYPMRAILNEDDRLALGMLGCVEALRFGTTTIVENYEGAADVVPSIQRLGVRGVLSEIVNDALMTEIRRGRYEYSDAQGERRLQAALDFVERWHGTEDGRITCQMSAHAPDTCTRRLLERVRDIAAERDLGLHIHLAQSATEVAQVEAREGMRSVEFLETTGFLGPRTIAAHCAFLAPNEVSILGRSSATVAHCSVVLAKNGIVAPILGLRGAGATIALGTDNMSEDMVEVMRTALIANRIREAGSCNAVLPPRPDSWDVLEWATINGARAVGLDREIGSLEVGKKADITLIDIRKPHLTPHYHPVTELVHYGIASDVDTVIVDGDLLVRDGRLLVIDEQQVIRDAQRQADDFWARFEAAYGGRVMARSGGSE